MENSIEKPWDNIPLKDIQPYPLNYNKIVVISYIFTILFVSNALIKKVFIPNIYELDSLLFLLVFLIPTLIYGIIAFVLSYLNAQGNYKLLLKDFIEDTKFVIPFFIMLVLINKFLIMKFAEDLNLPFYIMIILIFNLLFMYITLLNGPFSLLYKHHPQAKLHGIITSVPIFAVAILIWIF